MDSGLTCSDSVKVGRSTRKTWSISYHMASQNTPSMSQAQASFTQSHWLTVNEAGISPAIQTQYTRLLHLIDYWLLLSGWARHVHRWQVRYDGRVINTPINKQKYTVSRKKGTNSILGITSSNTGQFLKFFQCHNLLEICNKTVIKFPAIPQTRCYTTLWKTDVRKLACPEHCGMSCWKINLPDFWRVADNSCILKWNLLITTSFTNLLYQFSILFVIISRRFFRKL